MIRVGVADYGLNVWYGAMYDYKDRLAMLKELGFEGIERLEAKSAAQAMETRADARQMGMEFGTCRGGSAAETIRFTAGLGMKYVWAEPAYKNLELYCRQVNYQVEAAEKYGVKVALHNHLGVVEKSDEVEEFLAKCPGCGLILDCGHMAAAGGDPIYFIEKYFDRILAVHVKDYVYKDKDAKDWWDQLRFCELGAGEMGDLNKEILKLLVQKGYDGWVYVEHDTHLQDPRKDLKISRDFMRSCSI